MIARPAAHREGAIISDSFINSKKDKRTIKHSAFMNRIAKAQKKPLKRRRANKKLVTTMESLADALPDIEDMIGGDGQEGKIKMKSLKSKPGALKKKVKVERMERERFGKNMAQIMGTREEILVPAAMETENSPVAPPPAVVSARFAALRAWVNTNMEKHPGFEKGKQ
jgi:hypothetical protein